MEDSGSNYLHFAKQDLFQVQSNMFECFKAGSFSPANTRSAEREVK